MCTTTEALACWDGDLLSVGDSSEAVFSPDDEDEEILGPAQLKAFEQVSVRNLVWLWRMEALARPRGKSVNIHGEVNICSKPQTPAQEQDCVNLPQADDPAAVFAEVANALQVPRKIADQVRRRVPELWTLQLGAFRDRARTEQFQARIAAQLTEFAESENGDHVADVVGAIEPGGGPKETASFYFHHMAAASTLASVQVGIFLDRKSAQRAAGIIKSVVRSPVILKRIYVDANSI